MISKDKPVLFTCNHLESKLQSFNVIYFFTLGISIVIFISIHFLVHLLFHFANKKFVIILFFYIRLNFISVLFSLSLSLIFHFSCDKAYDFEQSNAPIHVLLDKLKF